MTAPRPFAEVLEELRRLGAEATPGPWALNNNGVQNMTDVCADGLVANIARWKDGKPDPDNTNDANAALIAAMRNALPALLSRLASREAVYEAAVAYANARRDLRVSLAAYGIESSEERRARFAERDAAEALSAAIARAREEEGGDPA